MLYLSNMDNAVRGKFLLSSHIDYTKLDILLDASWNSFSQLRMFNMQANVHPATIDKAERLSHTQTLCFDIF